MLKLGVTDSFRSALACHGRDRGVPWLVGPGLFLALLLLAPVGRAETAVGLDAQGVDPRAAISNQWGLDVRDAQGRPVTAQKVLADIKGATVKRAAANAFSSKLPNAKIVLSALELLAEAAAAFRLAAEAFSIPELLAALPGGSPKFAVLWMLVLACLAATTTFCCRSQTRLALSRSRQSSIEVLRC